MKPIICAPNFQFVIPGRRSEAEANPESSNHRPGLLDSGFSALGPRPTVSPRNDEANDSNLEIAELDAVCQGDAQRRPVIPYRFLNCAARFSTKPAMPSF